MVSLCMLNFRLGTLSAATNRSLNLSRYPRRISDGCSVCRIKFTVNVLYIEGIILHAALYVTDD